MVLNTSSLVLNNFEGQEYRRSTNKNLEKAGLIYVVSERDLEDFDRIADFSERVAGEVGALSRKTFRLSFCLLLLPLANIILTCLSILWPGVMEQHEVVFTILMSRAGPTLVALYIWRKLVDGAVYSKWKTIKHDRLELVRRVNAARRRLPVVACIIADGIMVSDADLLNGRCYRIVTRGDGRMRALLLDCVTVIVLGLSNCTILICWL